MYLIVRDDGSVEKTKFLTLNDYGHLTAGSYITVIDLRVTEEPEYYDDGWFQVPDIEE